MGAHVWFELVWIVPFYCALLGYLEFRRECSLPIVMYSSSRGNALWYLLLFVRMKMLTCNSAEALLNLVIMLEPHVGEYLTYILLSAYSNLRVHLLSTQLLFKNQTGAIQPDGIGSSIGRWLL